MKKEELYRWIKIGGMLSFIPIVLIAGLLAGYIIGDFLEKKFSLGFYALPVFMGIGIIVSIIEAIKIIKLALKIEKKA